MSGKRDSITVKDDNGEKVTLQKRILLNTIRETYELYLSNNNISSSSLSINSFGNLRPLNVLLNSHMSHRSCVCSYHENINLLLKPLAKYVSSIDLSTIQAFVTASVCDEENEDCMFSRCLLCSDNFNVKIQNNVTNLTEQIQWFQWLSSNGYMNKQEFKGTVQKCLTTLKIQLPSFLIHVFIKRKQSAHFETLKLQSDNESVTIQVDYSENFKIDIQDAVQGFFYTNRAVSLFTCYVWHSGGGCSFVFVSNNLSHDKYCISATIDLLFNKLKAKFQHLKQVHMFSDGAAQQFKQKFLFRNLCRLAEQFQVGVEITFLMIIIL
jgi:hypothetical protein